MPTDGMSEGGFDVSMQSRGLVLLLAVAGCLMSLTAAAEVPTVSIRTPTPQIVEGGSNGYFHVVREGMIADVTVVLQIGGTASNGVDYNLITNTVFIPAATNKAVIAIETIDDLFAEPLESVVLRDRKSTRLNSSHRT